MQRNFKKRSKNSKEIDNANLIEGQLSSCKDKNENCFQ